MTNPYLQIFKQKKAVPSRMSSREWAAVAPEVRQGAFFSAGVEDAFLLDGIRQMVENGIAEGWNEKTFVGNMRQWMRETTDKSTGKPYLRAEERRTWTQEERDAYENSTRHIDSLARLKLIFRTQMDMAVGVSFWQSEMTPERLQSHPAFRFVRRPGALTKRLDHVAHEDDVRLKTDLEYWIARNDPEFGGFGVPWPPYGYNSWMDVAPVSRSECEALGLIPRDAPAPDLTPEDRAKWGLPEAVQKAAEGRSVKKLSPEQREALQTFLGRRGIATRYDEMTGSLVRLHIVANQLQQDIEWLKEHGAFREHKYLDGYTEQADALIAEGDRDQAERFTFDFFVNRRWNADKAEPYIPSVLLHFGTVPTLLSRIEAEISS